MKYYAHPGMVKFERGLGDYQPSYIRMTKKITKRTRRREERREINAVLVELEEAA